jgi:hypothetical protein
MMAIRILKREIMATSDNGIHNHVAETVFNFCQSSAEYDSDVNSNMMLLALTILGILKKDDNEAYEIAMEQLGERQSQTH